MAPRERRDPYDTPEPEDPTKALLLEAKERFKRAQDWEGGVRKLYIDDVKFANGDADNGWQWPDNVKEDRDQNNRPCLTVNRTKTIVNKLVNEAKKNPPEPRVKPVGGDVSFEAAEVWQELIRHIQYVSNFAQVHGMAKENQLEGGIGYWHIAHDFVNQESFDQELKIEYLDPQYVFMDCDIKNPDGSDAMWGFIFDEYNRKEFHRLFPDVRIPTPKSPGLDDKDDWIRSDGVRVAQYYRINLTEDELVYLEDEQGNSWSGLKSDIPKQWQKLLKPYSEGKEGADYRSRKVTHRQLEWFKIVGSEIIDEDRDRRGQYIPIVRMPGRERKVEHRLHRAGIVRALKDPQRMYNYNTSGECEVVALQTKTPWIVASAAIEGNETAWARANTQNAAYLAFRHIDDDGEQIPPPTRAEGPTQAQGFLEGLRISAMEMEMASGIQMAQDTNPNIERTPKAINERVRSGEIINYDFVSAEMLAVRHTCVVLMDLAPHIYDTERVVQTMARDGTIRQITINPDQDEAFIKNKPANAEDPMRVLFNPKIGKFAIEADVGPAYQTQREQAWDAFIQIIQAQPELMNIMGDLGFRAGDFPLAQEIAQRIKRNIEANMPWLLDSSQTGPLVKQLQSDNANMTQQISELMEKLADQRGKTRQKEQLRDIEAQEADDNRLTTVVDALVKLHEIGINEQELRNLIHKTEHEMDHDWASLEVEKANQPSMEQGDTTTTTQSKSKGKTGTKQTKQTKVQKMVPKKTQ